MKNLLFVIFQKICAEKVRCPTLVVHGTHDADVKFYDCVYTYENIENAERIWVEEGSHLCFWINPTLKVVQKQAVYFLKKQCAEVSMLV